MAEHAQLAPSSVEKWLNCRGSLAMEAGLPESTSSYAEEGSATRRVAENVLNNRLNPTLAGKPLSGGQDAAYIGTYPLAKGGKPIGPQVTEEMAEHVQRYIDTV